MKRFFKLSLMIISFTLILFSCTSMNQFNSFFSNFSVDNLKSSELVDWKGKNVGLEVPHQWVTAIINSDYELLKSTPQGENLSDKSYIIIKAYSNKKKQNKNDELKLLQEKVISSYNKEISKNILDLIEKKYSSDLFIDINAKTKISSSINKIKWENFTRLYDSWIVDSVTNKLTTKTSDKYTYIAIFACDNENFKTQVESNFEKISNSTKNKKVKTILKESLDLIENNKNWISELNFTFK